MKRLIHLFALVGFAAYGCSESSEPLSPMDAAITQSDAAFGASVVTAPQAALAEPASLGPTFQFTGSADFADAFFFTHTAEGYVFASVYVFQEQSAGNRETGLGYDITKCDIDFFICETTEAGFGSIPSGDVAFSGGSVRLSTNTSADANPDFFRYLGEGGPLEVTWTRTPFFTTSRVSNERTQYGSIRFRVHDNSEYSSAMTEATFFSDQLLGEGSFGSSQTTQIEMSVGGVVAAASGSGHLTVDGENRTFSFHALQTADGRVGGEWQRLNRAAEAEAHGKITCMGVSGSTAWLGGFSTTSSTGTGTVRWRVFDGGRSGGEDAISLQDVLDPANTEAYCYGQPDYPELLPIESGNVTIRP